MEVGMINVQFKDESYAAQSPYEVRFSDEADLEVWERGRSNDDWDAAPSVLHRREARRRDRDPI
jgi:hypothetical protein